MKTPTHRPIVARLIGRRELWLAIGAVTFAAMLWLLPSAAGAANAPVTPPREAAVFEDTCTSTGREFGIYSPEYYAPYYFGFYPHDAGNPYYYANAFPSYGQGWAYYYGPVVTRSYPCNANASCVPVALNSEATVCPGQTASISLQAPSSVSCGGASNITATLKDSKGLLVSNGTEIGFQTTLGYVSTSNGSEGGQVTTSLNIPPKTSGTAVVTASVGSVSARTTISVSC